MYIPPSIDSAASVRPTSYFLADDGDDDATKQQKWSSLIGVSTAIVGNVLISFALNTQRYAHMRLSREREEKEEKQRRARRGHKNGSSYGTHGSGESAEGHAKAERRRDDEGDGERQPLIQRDTKGSGEDEDDAGSIKEKSYLKSKIWWAGITMMVLGEAGNFLAYGFAPASVVSPLGVVALVSNCLIAPLFLHERFRWRDALGVVIAVGGCVTIVLSESDSNPRLGPDEIWDLISQWEFETYLGITIFLMIVLAVASNKFGERTILIDLGLVGLFGGYTALSTKGVASLLSNTIWRVVTFPITYLLVAVLVFTAIMQIKYVNRALQRFNSTMVIPTQFVLFTISVIVGSAVLYRDFERTTPGDAGKFIGGCALTFLGVWCITSGRSGGEDEGDEEMGLEEVHEDDEPHTETRERSTEGRKPSVIVSSSKSTPRLYPATPTPAAEDLTSTSYKSSYFTPQTHASYPSEPLPPGTQAAIHSASTSDLPADPDPNRTLQPPPFHATTSAPVIPTTDVAPPSPSPSPRPRTPLKRGVTHTGDSPHSPVTPRRQPHLDASADQRQRLINRHSVAGLLPAPYTSPLSSSLSAIVADSLRRGDTQSSPLRRRSTKFRRKGTGELGAAAGAKRHSIADGELSGQDEEEGGSGEGRPGMGAEGRLRSLSATLGEAFSSVKGKGSGRGGARKEGDGDEEAGPSGS